VKVTVNGKDVPSILTRKPDNPAVATAVAAAGYRRPRCRHREDVETRSISSVRSCGADRTAVQPGDLRHMVYGPIAAMLVELFPTKIRYTRCSLPTTSVTAGSVDYCRDLVFAIVASKRYLRRPVVSDHLRIDHRGRRLFFLPETKDVDIKTN